MITTGDSDIKSLQEFVKANSSNPIVRGLWKLLQSAAASLDSVSDIPEDATAGTHALAKKFALIKLEEFKSELGFEKSASPSPKTSFH